MLSTIYIIYHILVSATLRVKMACLITWLPSHATGKTHPLQSDSINLGWAALATSFLYVFLPLSAIADVNILCLQILISKPRYSQGTPSLCYTSLRFLYVFDIPKCSQLSPVLWKFFHKFFYVRLLIYTPTPKRNLYSVARWWSWTYQNVFTRFPCHVWPTLQILWKVVNTLFPYFASRRPWWR